MQVFWDIALCHVGGLFDPDCGSTTILRNVRKFLATNGLYRRLNRQGHR